MSFYHRKLNREKQKIAEETLYPEKITVGLNRFEGFQKLISYYKCNIGIELGVRECYFSEFLTFHTRLYQVHGIDITDSEQGRILEKRTPNYKFHQKDSLEAYKLWPDNWFDFIHIDDCHKYQHVKKELKLWWPKLNRYGIFSGDDALGSHWNPDEGLFGVSESLHEFVEEYRLQYYLIGVDEIDMKKLDNIENEQGEQLTRKYNGQTNTFKFVPNWFIIKK